MIVVDGLVVVTVPGSLDVDGAEVDRPVAATDPRSLDVDGAVVDSLKIIRILYPYAHFKT